MEKITRLLEQFSFINTLRFSALAFFRKALNPDSYFAYSQTGEDIIIRNILQSIDKGFYIEIGSNEPIQHSNTFGLYQKGWRGVTVDANQKMVDMHRKLRPKDIAICAAVSDEEKDVVFYEFDMDEISTIDADFYNKNKDIQQVARQTKLRTKTLESIVTEHVPVNTSIDLLSIDVEGHDFHVLKSLDLRRHRPKLIVIEMHDFTMLNPMANEIYAWLIGNNYHIIGYAVWNGYFLSNEFELNE